MRKVCSTKTVSYRRRGCSIGQTTTITTRGVYLPHRPRISDFSIGIDIGRGENIVRMFYTERFHPMGTMINPIPIGKKTFLLGNR